MAGVAVWDAINPRGVIFVAILPGYVRIARLRRRHMVKKILFTLALAALTTLAGGAQDAKSVVSTTSKAMGADQLKTIQLSGSGMEYAFGQAYNPSSPWPGWKMKSETRTIDFDAPAMRIERVADTPDPARKGGGLQPGAMQQLIVNANTPWPNQLPIWLTPYGFLRQAAKNDVTLGSATMGGKKYSVVTFMAPNKAKVNGYIGADNMLAKVETWIDSPMLGDSVFLIMPAYAAIAVDMKDGIVVLEGPQSTMRSEQIIAEVHKDIPNKPIKYVFNTHNHFDHSSGLRAFVAEGATIITSQSNKGYFEKIFALPHTLVPDKLSQNHAKVKVELVGDKRVLTDGVHTIEIHKTQGSLHNEGLLFAYLPKEKVLLEADSFNPPATADAAAPPNPANALLVDNINRLKLDVETLVPVHYPADGRKVSIEELKRAVGQRATK